MNMNTEKLPSPLEGLVSIVKTGRPAVAWPIAITRILTDPFTIRPVYYNVKKLLTDMIDAQGTGTAVTSNYGHTVAADGGATTVTLNAASGHVGVIVDINKASRDAKSNPFIVTITHDGVGHQLLLPAADRLRLMYICMNLVNGRPVVSKSVSTVISVPDGAAGLGLAAGGHVVAQAIDRYHLDGIVEELRSAA